MKSTLPQLPQDKANHVIYGVAVFMLAATLLSPVSALVLTVLVGAGKEAWDATGRGCVEWRDFVATAAGGVAGFACTLIG